MMDESIGLLVIISVIWIGHPPYKISDHLGALRKIAEGSRRGH